jgi:TolB protein
MSRLLRALLCSAVLALLVAPVKAELTVDITKGTEGALPIVIVPFGQESLRGDNLATIISTDLVRSGRFSPLPDAQMPERPVPPETVNFGVWQSAGQEHVVIGRVVTLGENSHEVAFSLYDAIRGSLLVTQRIPFKTSEARHTAHRIADIIYKQITGERGIFNTRVAFVSATGSGKQREYRLQIADTDGHDPRTVISSAEPIMSPAWSPNGKRIAYVSFEEGGSAIYLQDLGSGERQKLSDAPGINGAPAWSPDGGELALTLSKEGSPDIYTLSVATRSLRRVTRDAGIETEASWSPDGRHLVFTSDRGGKPQLYLISVNGGEPQRLTYDGAYNARGVFSPDGRHLAMVQGGDGGYRIAVMDMASRSSRVLTRGSLDESPGFSPDGRTILYIRKDGGPEQLAAVSLDGKQHFTVPVRAGDVRGAAWSP